MRESVRGDGRPAKQVVDMFCQEALHGEIPERTRGQLNDSSSLSVQPQLYVTSVAVPPLFWAAPRKSEILEPTLAPNKKGGSGSATLIVTQDFNQFYQFMSQYADNNWGKMENDTMIEVQTIETLVCNGLS